ncbi:DUF4435 domain-containing protein [Exiguobacterium sp. s189]|uniref:DUF4435 domain-containing protein n=1 Tax=Exiguobacterium sp. s189 TaxID=2751263 RepID=UPI001BE9C326|nr:DUF4435 domain-containing protein [Exiguobacterium sp. s189]
MSEMTIDEMVSYLNHSQIPTLLVEGRDDFQIYRWLEDKLDFLEVDILPCGGRNNLLNLFESRHLIEKQDILFFADSDLWLFSEIPAKYKGIIFTKGYSIENDIYTSCKNSIESLIDSSKISDYHKAIRELSKWYTTQVEEYLKERDYQIKDSPRSILDNKTFELQSRHMPIHPEILNSSLYEEISTEYYHKLRGKNLFDLFEWFVEEKSIKREALFEIVFKFMSEDKIEIVKEFRGKLETLEH